MGASAEDEAALIVADQPVQCVSLFVYLGCAISQDARIAGEVDRRVANAANAFGLLWCVFLDPKLSLLVKKILYADCATSPLLYASECWPLLKCGCFLPSVSANRPESVSSSSAVGALEQL